MATKTFYLLNSVAVTPNWWGNMQDGGSAPAAANSAFGFTVGKVAVTTPFWRARLGATSNAQTSAAASHIASTTSPQKGTGSGNGTAGDSFVSPAAYTGVFAAGNWVFNFNCRAGTVTPVGRMRAQVWASANADGTSARKLTSSVLVGSTVTMSTTTTTYNSTVTWAAPQVTLSNEYLFIQLEWEETTAGGSNSTAVQFYQSAAAFTTTDFVASINATGDLDPTNADVDGVGTSGSTGVGDIDPAEADVVGLGTSGSEGLGDLDAGVSTISGIASVVHSIGTGDIDAGGSTLIGVGTSASRSTSATLVDGSASVSGVGVSLSTFTGSLVAGSAGIAGVGDSFSVSSGTLVAGSVSLAGSGSVSFGGLDAAGVLASGSSTLAGSATVTWPVISGSGLLGANTPPPNFLLHGESFVDSAGGHTVTPGGSTISATQQKFGTSSFFIDSNDAVRLDAAADLNIGSTDNFTIDLWVYPTTTASVHPFAAWNDGATDNLVLCIRGSGCLQVFDHGGLIIVGSTTFTVNAWSHVALTRSGGSVRAFLNGVQQGSTNNSNTQTFPVSGTAPKFGNGSVGGTQQFQGYLDELRFIKGIAVWTSNFTPPPVPYDLGSPAVVAGLGTSGSTGTGVLVAGSSVVAGVATSRYTSTGTLADAASTVAGVGVSASSSTGSLVVGVSTLSGTATARWDVQGTLVSQSSILAGTGTARSIGTGSLVANASTIVGTSGPVIISATGNLVVGAASLISTVTVSSRGTGALVVSSSVLSGSATATYYGTGTLQVRSSVLAGSSFSGVAGTGTLVSASSIIVGSATVTWYTTGTLQASASSLTGSARVISTGTGQLAANDSVVTGHGLASWNATGTLVAGDATLSGVALSGATFGIGDLVVGNAILDGDGGTAPALGGTPTRIIVTTDTSTTVTIDGSSRIVTVTHTPIASPTIPQSPRLVTTGNGGRTVVVNNGHKRKLVA